MRVFLLALLILGCSDPPAEGCTQALDCADGQLCREGTCVTPAPCDEDLDCGGGTVCVAGACLAVPCDGECTGGRVCVAGLCTPGQACDGDEDCPGARCDRTTGQCGLPSADCGVLCADAGGCVSDEGCAEGEYCAPEGCLPGCRADSCGAGEVCDPATHTCRCAADTACPGGSYCAEGACTEGCRIGGDDCPAPSICLAESHTCGCSEDTHCAADAYCAEGVCTPGCRLGGCPEGEVCDPTERRCGPPSGACQRDLDCPPTDYCLDGLGCAPGCREGGCPGGQACDLASRQCRCADDAGCPARTWCDNGACVPGCKATGEGCATGVCDVATHQCHCENDGQCVAGEYCGGGRCTPGCRLVPDDCQVGRCSPATHQCEAGACGRDVDCPNGQACLLVVENDLPVLQCGAALADGRAEAPCRNDLQCASRLCLNAGHCFSACERDADCPSRRCVTINITIDDGDPVEFQSCAPALVQCGADVDCPMGQACLPTGDDPAQPARPLMACRAPVGLPGGAACADAGQCASNVCIDGACWQPCVVGQANHCPAGRGCYPNQVHFLDDRGTPAQPADDRFWGMAGCVPSQGSDARCLDGRCPAGEVCTVRLNQLGDAFDRICRTPVGAAGSGAACRLDTDCRSGVCVNQQLCLGICDPRNPAGQCVAGQCGEIGFIVNDRDPATPDDDVVDEVSACIP